MSRKAGAVAVMVAVATPFVGSLTVATGVARADTACADVWLVKDDGSRKYVVGPDNCVETGFSRLTGTGAEPTSEDIPGCLKGVGFEIWITSPV